MKQCNFDRLFVFPILSVAAVTSGASAQTAATQPVPGATPAIIYLLPEGSAPPGRAPAGFNQVGTTVVPPSEIAQRYSCVIRIDSEGDLTTTTFGYVNDSQSALALLTSTAIIDPTAKQVLGDSVPATYVVVNVFPATARLARVEVTLRKDESVHYPSEAAPKLCNALLARLKTAYSASAAAEHKAASQRRAAIEDQLKSAQTRLDDLRHQEREIRLKAALANVNPQSDVTMQVGSLTSQKTNAENDLRRTRARLNSLDSGSGQLVGQWTEIVAVRQARVDELTKVAADPNASKTTPQQLRDAKSDLAEAKAQLEQARTAPDVQPNESRQRTFERANLRATLAEQEDRLKQLTDQLARIQDPALQSLLEQFPQVQALQMPLRNQINDLQNRLEQLRRSTREEGAVTITVLDGR